ncbi:YjcQ family protein [Limosilactobacillus fermentum]|uniref:YjcQ family protein n=1 Tax=Limosilactobacillus fermentum TaxID=1613 RepID=UPI001CD8D4F2|nr:YjcQ family protein [Limosilactobacillus fermentum]MCQ2007933.1 YjcQ family protein [Limosilactobacillus fermentum]MDA3725269.1 YjcQ family protein [Limosilactobacillus fermentum]MDA3761150.1 YjcQ family protein [Limosilactobacillus fermentum]MDN3537431.1 YjcQ family protein [Limosilactobacillus fermentum]UTF48054.1 YjcQ family protein [Limosilactobacillus fermentum]
MSDHNYIEGVTFTHTKEGVLYSFQDARITIEGLEYLAENSMMQKAFRIFKSFKEWL